MRITAEPLPQRQVQLEIEVEPERHNEAIEKAYRKLAPRVRIPGFRPGKAPRPLIEKQLGRQRLLHEAMEILVPDVYKEAIEEQKLDPVASPELEVLSHEPFVLKATVPLKPHVDLGDYKSLRVPRPPVSISEQRVEDTLTTLRRRYGTIEPVDRPAQKGDIIRGTISVEVDGSKLYEQSDIEYRLSDDSLRSLPGLAGAIVGLSKGADETRKVQVPEDFEDKRLAGKEVTYHIVVEEVKEERLAELNDEFAREVGEGFASLDELKDRLRSDLLAAEEDEARHAYQHEVIEALVAQAKFEYPSVLLEREIDRVLEEQANLDPRDPRAQELYISRIGKSEQEVRDEVREMAEARLRRSLVLTRFAEAENISVTHEEIDAEIDRMAASAGDQADTIRRVFGTESGHATIENTLLTRKTLERLVELASAGSPAEAPEAPKPAKKRRSAPREAGQD
ncbi:MAG TPA: trigger factor [Dehalococcoidia bacterium]|nr:trigger factor [Dehalococcoidia bacterium]